MDIDRMKAGRKMNVLVVEVMGWKVYKAKYNGSTWTIGPLINPPEMYAILMGNYISVVEGGKSRHWNPSQDIAVAWEAVEKFREQGGDVTLRTNGRDWECVIFPTAKMPKNGPYRAYAFTAPLAICRAALLTMGVEDA